MVCTLLLYWTQALAEQDDDTELKGQFTPVAQALADNEAKWRGWLDGSGS